MTQEKASLKKRKVKPKPKSQSCPHKIQRQIQINKPCGTIILSSENNEDTMDYLIKKALEIIREMEKYEENNIR
jgi:hypothetical protein